jgi:hypothetical protein
MCSAKETGKLVDKLRKSGLEAVAASPNSGVNTLTGEGLSEALKGASVVVDVSNCPSWEDGAVLKITVAEYRPRERHLDESCTDFFC